MNVRLPALLLVDDRPASLETLTAALGGLDVHLVRAASSDDALRRVLADDFAVIVLDVDMASGADAFATARLITGEERSRGVPIIFMIPRNMDRPMTFADQRAGGMVHVLYTPLDAALARAKVAVFLELHRLRAESARSERYERANAGLRATNAALESARGNVEAAQRAKDQFLATMSHEIRTPINAIIGYAEMIDIGIAGPITDQQRAYLARLDASSHHLLELINDILDLSKIDADEMHMSHDESWTGAIVASAMELVAPQATARGVKLIDARPSTRGFPFVGDSRRVRQILVNLLANAIKFTEAGGSVTVDLPSACRDARDRSSAWRRTMDL